MSLKRAWPFAIAAIALVSLAFSVAAAWGFTVDDTYITLRYSRNVAEGLGPTYNAVGPRAEGYTTFAWMIALVVPHALGLDAVLAAKALGVAATAGTLLVSAGWALAEASAAIPGDAQAASWAGAATLTLLAAVPATAIHAVSGMETALFGLLVTSLFATAAALVRRAWSSATANRLAAIALLAGLTRPEGNLAALLTFGATALALSPAARLPLARRALFGWALPIAAYELWRRSYYGLWFPLPFYVKLATPGLLPGWPDVLAWLGSPVLRFAPLALLGIVRPPRSMAPALVSLGALVAFFVLPQHQMGYDHRYLAPLDPTVAVLAGLGLARLVHRLSPPLAARRSLVNAGAAVVLVGSAALEAINARAVIASEADYGAGLASGHARLGRDLRALDLPGGRLAISDAGATPYLSRWWTLDLVGLNDAAIATSGRRDPAWVLSHTPDVVVLASPRADRVEPWDWNTWEPALYDACVAAGFERVGLRRFADDYWLWVLARPDSEAGRRFARLEASRAAR